VVHGVPVTSVERTIVDSFEDGEQPEQVELAVHQAFDRGLTTPTSPSCRGAESFGKSARFLGKNSAGGTIMKYSAAADFRQALDHTQGSWS
jgi:hypothetical protein